MKISYVTTYDALDVHHWSGLGFYIAKGLERQNNELDYIGNLNAKAGLLLKLKSQFYKRIIKKEYFIERNPGTAYQFSKQILSSINKNTDIIFSPGSVPLSLLETNKPKVFYTDATFAGMIGFYEKFSNLSNETIKNGNYLEQKALESAAIAIYSSDWAAQTAIKNYKVDPGKVKVVPFGANLECNRSYKDIQEIVSARSGSECHLLFLGVEWKRKGGDMAVKVAEKLNLLGIKTTLHVAGINKIPMNNIPKFVKNYGFISKTTQEGRYKMDAIFSKCHFLILPTQAEAYGLVFCESNSFGVPNISTKVGGVTTIIKDNLNGMTFSLNDNADAYAGYIQSVFANQELYRQLAFSSFNEYTQRLNWDVAGRTITKMLKDL